MVKVAVKWYNHEIQKACLDTTHSVFIPRLSSYCTVCVNKMILNNEKIPETHKVAFFNFVAGRKTCKGTIATISGSLSTHVKDVD